MATLEADYTPGPEPIGRTDGRTTNPDPATLVLTEEQAITPTDSTPLTLSGQAAGGVVIWDAEDYGGPKWLTAPRRRWIYGIILALLPLLVTYGVLAAEDVAIWIGVASAVLGLGLATSKTED